jgi:ATP-dependent helicase/nuclease subunit B
MARVERTAYNAEMGSNPEANLGGELDRWLKRGGRVAAASERAARATLAEYHRSRRREGLAAWAAPDVLSWQTFARQEWEQRRTDGRLILNSTQERALWAGIIRSSGHGAGLLEGPMRRLAALSMEAHSLLCAYAPQMLEARARRTWYQDSDIFSGWLEEFDAECRAKRLVSEQRIAREITSLLREEDVARPGLMLAGFDRMTPAQANMLEAWGQWSFAASGERAREIRSYAAPDDGSELASCARWCGRQLEAAPESRLLVITQETADRRGEIERAFLREGVPHEFSLGVPLATVGVVRCATLLLHWLDGPLDEHEIDWLCSVPYTGSTRELAALQAYHRALRRKSLERTQWTLETFLNLRVDAVPPETWAGRMRAVRERLRAEARRARRPMEWTELVPELLKDAGWPGVEGPTSSEFQAMRRWEQALAVCGSLGFDGRRMAWREFLADLDQALNETLFAPESEDAPVLIAGPAESAGLTADALWFLGADQDSWPPRGSLHPLLQLEVQRAAKMPHATAQQDRELAQAMTERLLRSAAMVRFSHARLKEGVETRGSRVIAELAGAAEPLPAELAAPACPQPRTVRVVDDVLIPLRAEADGETVAGGSTVLTAQSLCPFQAFARERLGAERWEAAQAGLTALVRGNLLHEAMSGVWGGPATGGIRTLEELKALPNVTAFVTVHVKEAMQTRLPVGAREQMPARYLELEELRLTRLVTEWLRYEAARVDFTVEETESKHEVAVAGLRLRVRMDRVDRLNDGSLLVIDYKTGNITPRQWELPRPENVQLPLYAGFALPHGSNPGGLAFAQVRTGEMAFAGCLKDAKGTLDATLTGRSGLVKNPLTDEQMDAWHAKIEALARDFLAGRADVDPREIPDTCDKCGLHALCRIHETAAFAAGEASDEIR